MSSFKWLNGVLKQLTTIADYGVGVQLRPFADQLRTPADEAMLLSLATAVSNSNDTLCTDILWHIHQIHFAQWGWVGLEMAVWDQPNPGGWKVGEL